MKKLWLGLILVIGLVPRLRNFWLLPVDAHPMRQTDTECVAYFLATGEADILHPKNCLIRPVTNTEGFFYLEFPAYQLLLALSYKLVGIGNILGPRLVNLSLYGMSGLGLYSLTGSLGAVLLFVLAPGSIFFVGHAIHPDVLAVTTMIWGLVMLKRRKVFWGGILLGLSVATRPFGLIAWPVMFWYLWRNKARKTDYLLVGVLTIGFYVWWRWWTTKVGIDASWENWVLEGREKIFDLGILKNLIWKNVVGEVMGRTISLLALLGLVRWWRQKDGGIWPYIGWLLMVPVYWCLVPNGNLTHQYYADVYLVPVAIIAAYGWEWLWQRRWWLGVLTMLLVGCNGWRTSGYYFDNVILPEKLEFAKEMEENIPADGRILYLVKSDSVPLSLSHRQGWMLGEWPTDVAPHPWSIMEMKNLGIEYLVRPKIHLDITTEEMKVVEENFPKWKETKNLEIFKWQKG